MKHLYIILLILPLIGFGQGWETTFGGTGFDSGRSVQQTTDGGYIITGCTDSFGSDSYYDDVYLIKTDENGNEQWSKTFGEEVEMGYSVQQTNDGGYIITGKTSPFSNGDGDLYLIKTNENGDEQWSQTFGGEEYGMTHGYSVKQTFDGGYIITGKTLIYQQGFGGLLLKVNSNGEVQWYKTISESIDIDQVNIIGNSVQQTSDNGFFITGQINLSTFDENGQIYPLQYDIYLVKTDESGNEQWTKTLGGTGSETGYSGQQTNDGGYIITGSTSSFGNGYKDVYLIKTDSSGNEQWTKTFGGSEEDVGHSIQQTSDEGYIITGYTKSYGDGFYDSDIYLIKTDDSGNEQWSQTFGGTGLDRGYSVQQTSDGGFVITGISNLSEENDVFLIKTDSEGNVETTSTIELPTPQSKRELIKTTNILGQENTTIKNQPLIEIYDDGSVEKKYIIK